MSLVESLVAELSANASVLSELRSRAAAAAARVVFCEAEDPRVAAAACVMREFSLANLILCGDPTAIRASLSEQGADPGRFDIVAPDDSRLERVREHLLARRAAKGMDAAQAAEHACDPLMQGASLVALGAAEAMVAGAVRSTADVIRAGLWCVGLPEGIDVVSASFLMVPPQGHVLDRPLLFADSAIVPRPTSEQLVSIGLASAGLWRGLFGTEPKIACLSFSTHGSADHEDARRMQNVSKQLQDNGLQAEGELQLDAALLPEVAVQKSALGAVSGSADILLFPDLGAANIGYKMAERLGGLRAVGPLVQGLAKPVFDLSRGCSAVDIVDTAAIAVLSGREGKGGA